MRTKKPLNKPKLSRSDLLIWGSIQKALHEKIRVTKSGETLRLPRLKAFVETISVDAARGNNPGAVRLQRKMLQHFDKKRPAEIRKFTAHQQIVASAKKCQTFDTFYSLISSYAYYNMIGEIIEQYTAVHGDLRNPHRLVPFCLDLELFSTCMKKLHRKIRRATAKGALYDVGRGKPPKATRYLLGKSGNPSGKKKFESFEQSLRDALVAETRIRGPEGEPTQKTRASVMAIQLFNESINGSATARQEFWNIVQALDERDLLSPPARKRRRRPIPADFAAKMKAAEVMVVPSLKRKLIALFDREYQPVPPFTTRYELSLPALHEIEGWAGKSPPVQSQEPSPISDPTDYSLDFEHSAKVIRSAGTPEGSTSEKGEGERPRTRR